MITTVSETPARAREKENKMYKTEPHIHTREISNCGQVEAAEMVRIYAEAGYDTIFIADHINGANFGRWTGLSWAEKVDKHKEGYEAARRMGDELGITVLYCAEIAFRYDGETSNDYLVYGFDRDFLIGLEDYYGTSIENFYPYAKSRGVTVIQAHPFRRGCVPTPDFVDGVEVYNAHPRHINNNDKALALAKERGFLMTAGSDFHMAEDAAGACVMTEEPIRSAQDYIAAIKSGKATLVGREGIVC